jgi:outer membrane receptor protein involved in Fe transport
MRARFAALATTAVLAGGPAWADDDPPDNPPLRASETVVVTATRTEQPASETVPNLIVLTAQELDAAAPPTIDDALRAVPGFNLFRRTGSRVANPTSQGVSMRGQGPSGASRALVLADGLPLNDPFGGWIYWGRIPREAVDRIEVLRGGASDLYGSSALGGVIQILTRPPGARPALAAEGSFGNQGAAEGSFSAGGRRDNWGARLSAGGLTTDGYVLVAEDQRGPVDTPAAVRLATADLTFDHSRPGTRVFVRGSLFGESRDNGTPLQTNDTHLRQLVVGAERHGARLGSLDLRLHASAQEYDQSFSAVSADRASEALNRRQHVPAQDAGFSLQWSRPLGSRHRLVAGLAGREVRGASDEVAFVAGTATTATGAGGRERTASVFAEDVVRFSPRVLLSLSARWDRWSHRRALSVTTPVGRPSAAVVRTFPDREESSLNPRAALLVNASDRLQLTLAGYRSFRGPTLNELYRGFRVGDVVTQANESLTAEHLHGGEAGARWRGGPVTLSGTAFWTETRDPVANVTLSVMPRLTTRQRQNLGRTRARGLELDAEARFRERWTLVAGYALTDGVVSAFPAGPELEGKMLPQLPRHQASLRARYQGERLRLSATARLVGRQFEDDRNELALDSFAVLDLVASHRLGRTVEAFVAAENVFDERYVAGLTPVATVGQPRLVRVGLRLRLGGDGR